MSTTSGQGNKNQPAGGSSDEALAQAYLRDRSIAEASGLPGDRLKTVLRKLVLYLLPVLLILFLIDLVVERALPRDLLMPYGDAWALCYTVKMERFLEEPTPDVLFLGSSRIRLGVNSGLFSNLLSEHLQQPTRTFNLGLDGARAEELLTVVNSYIPDPAPPRVVIGVSSTSVGLPHTFKYASRFLWRFSDFAGFLHRTAFHNIRVEHIEYFIESLLCRHWYLFKNRDALARYTEDRLQEWLGIELSEDYLAMFARSLGHKAHVMAADGYQAVHDKGWNLQDQIRLRPETIQISQRFLGKDPTTLNKAAMEVLEQTVRGLKAKGARVILVETPVSPFLMEQNPDLNGPYFLEWMQRASHKLDVPYLPFPFAETRLDNTFFDDYSHLSPKGADAYTRLLFSKLKEAGFFEEARP